MARDVSVFSYLSARIVAAVANLVTVKLLIDFVVKEDYGRWGMLTSATGMLVPVLTLTLPAAMMRMFFDLDRDDRTGQARLITTTFNLSLVGAAVLVIAALASGAAGLISLATTAYLVAGTSGAVVYRFLNYLTRLRDDRGMYFLNEVADRAAFMALLAAANTGAGAWLLTPFHGNRLVAAAVYFGVTRWAVNLICVAYYGAKHVLVTAASWLRGDELRAMISFSLPITVVFFLGWVLASSDLFLLERLSTPDQLADYAFAVGVASVVALVTQSVLTDWPRFYYEQMRDDTVDRDEQIARRVRLVLWMHVGGILLLRLVAGFAYDLYGAHSYAAGLGYVQYLVLANFFFLAGNLFGSGVSHTKKTHLSIVAFGLAGGVNVALNLWLIPRFGAAAAAWTTLGSNVLFAVASWWIGRQHYEFTHVRWHLAPATAALLVGLLPLRYALPL